MMSDILDSFSYRVYKRTQSLNIDQQAFYQIFYVEQFYLNMVQVYIVVGRENKS